MVKARIQGIRFQRQQGRDGSLLNCAHDEQSFDGDELSRWADFVQDTLSRAAFEAKVNSDGKWGTISESAME